MSIFTATITVAAYAALLPHARAVLELTSDGMSRIADYLGHSGSYPAARDLFQLIVQNAPAPIGLA